MLMRWKESEGVEGEWRREQEWREGKGKTEGGERRADRERSRKGEVGERKEGERCSEM